MKFLFAYLKNDNHLIKMELEDGKEVWAKTTKAVYSWAKKTYKEGENLNIEYTKDDRGKYTVTRITALGDKTEKKPAAEKKAYAKPSKYSQPTSPNTQDLIVRQSCMRGSCQAVTTLVGQVNDPDTLGDIIVSIYEKLYNKIVNG